MTPAWSTAVADSIAPMNGSDQVKSAFEQQRHDDGKGRHPVDAVGQDGVDPVRPRMGAGRARRPAAHLADDGLNPAVARPDEVLVELHARPGGLPVDIVDPLPHRRRQALDIVVVRVRGVGQQRPDRPRAPAGRRADERGPFEGALDLGDGGLHRGGEAGPGHFTARREVERAADGGAQSLEPGPGRRDGRDDVHAEPAAEPVRIQRHAAGRRLVDHVERPRRPARRSRQSAGPGRARARGRRRRRRPGRRRACRPAGPAPRRPPPARRASACSGCRCPAGRRPRRARRPAVRPAATHGSR